MVVFSKRTEKMSLCRFSSDGFQCDLYVYQPESDNPDDWMVHVASRRTTYSPPPLPKDGDAKAIADWQMGVMHNVKNHPRVVIGGKYDGETFICESSKECLDTVKMLKQEGYRFPDRVIELLEEEIAEK